MSKNSDIAKSRTHEHTDVNVCFHCGDGFKVPSVLFDEKAFCCEGCKRVYELLNTHQLCDYYEHAPHPGIKIEEGIKPRFDYLDAPDIVRRLITYQDSSISKITFYIPQMHCSSCIWLLENLGVLNDAVTESRVHFVKKEVYITFKNTLSLRGLVELLSNIGYEPLIQMDVLDPKTSQDEPGRKLWYKLGVTGFCAGNIMLFSFPEYFGDPVFEGSIFQKYFSYFNLALSLPVVFFGAWNYFRSAFNALKHKTLNMDVPIALGTGVVFLRSVYEVLSATGVGYFDSLTGLVFFLLIGQWMQQKTYRRLGFENHYQSYFPMAVTRLNNKGQEEIVLANSLLENDLILIHHQEIIPCDCVLLSPTANLDYSFVTGESRLEKIEKNALVYAGARLTGASIHLKVLKPVSASHLTQLWNHDVFQKKKSGTISDTLDLIGRRFVLVTLLVTLLTFIFWQFKNPDMALWASVSVLLVACPCAIALAMPFGLSNSARWLSKQGFYVKNPIVIEKLAKINHLVFDKTGTLTESQSNDIQYFGESIPPTDECVIKTMTKHSLHPLSQSLNSILKGTEFTLDHFEEHPGLGIHATYQGRSFYVGSATYTGATNVQHKGTQVHIAIDGHVYGYFAFNRAFRKAVLEILPTLKSKYQISLLSGDFNTEASYLSKWFKPDNMHFEKKPEQKLAFIQNLQTSGQQVLMIGDGLNDAGALKASDVGMSVSDHIYHFSPACDMIAEAEKLAKLLSVLQFSNRLMKTLWISFILSFLYNIFGFYFAFTGQLSPLFAAILMPVSSITVVLTAVITSQIVAKRYLK